MYPSLADDTRKNVVIYINDFYPEFATAFTKLSQKLERPLRGIMLVDAERKASGKNLPDKEGFFEEIVVDFSDDAALRRTIKPLEDQLLLASCDSERSQLYFKRVIPHIPYVNTPTESSLIFSTDKGKMRELFIGYDPSISPKAIVVHDASEDNIAKACSVLDFPLIIKPTTLDDSILVDKVRDEHELKEMLGRSFEILHEIYSEHRGFGDETMIIEEFMEGEIYSADAYVNTTGEVYVLPFLHSKNGVMVGLEGYQIYQSETHLTLGAQETAKGIEAVQKAIHAIGLRSSVAHIELFNTKRGWKIIEIAARPGAYRQEAYAVSYGIDHALNELLVKIGLKPEMPITLKEYSATFKIHAPRAGIVESIMGLDEARKHPSMYRLDVDVSPGDRVLPSTQGGGVLISGLMHNKDHRQLDRDIEVVRANITVNLKPGEMSVSNE